MELGWIDYSEADREKVMSVLAALQEPTAVDEIGIGIIRDAFAQKLFPATSVLMTRAKYFFVVPYALRDMERSHKPGISAAALKARYDTTEQDIAKTFISEVVESGQSTSGKGIVGARSLGSDCSGNWVKRGPAVMYWSGLRQLGFLTDGQMSYDAFFRYIESLPDKTRTVSSEDDKASGWNDDDSVIESKWHVPADCYKGPGEWRKGLTMDLSQSESEFLCHQITNRFNGSLYALLLTDGTVRQIAIDAMNAPNADGDEPAELLSYEDAFYEFCLRAEPNLPDKLTYLCRQARLLSDFVYALRIRYNAQLHGHEEEAEDVWQEEKDTLIASIAQLDVKENFDAADVWNHSGSSALYAFLNATRNAFLAGDLEEVDRLIKNRECRIKGARRKIGKTEGIPEAWRGGRRLSYRFEVAFRMLEDMVNGGGLDA